MFIALTDHSGEEFVVNANYIVSIRKGDDFLPNVIELIGGRTIHIKDENSMACLISALKVIDTDK